MEKDEEQAVKIPYHKKQFQNNEKCSIECSQQKYDSSINTEQTLIINYELPDSKYDYSPQEIYNTKLEPGCSEEKIGIYKTPHSQRTTRSKTSQNGANIKSTPKSDCILSTPTRKKTSEKCEKSTPIPSLNWADCNEIWQNIIYKEEACSNMRSHRLFDGRAAYLPRMRAILLDWIMEVCEVYRLRRNTYYLSVDYIDRYLTLKPSIPKTQLQLLGVSCLFIAAKLEEIYPPKLSEFSYVCDGACTETEILACEILLLSVLEWDVNPMTPTGWLNLYMQIHHDKINMSTGKSNFRTDNNFQFPQYSGYQFVRASQLIDLFTMDPGYLRFSYSTIAAASMYYIYGKSTAIRVSGLKWKHLKHCVEYMQIFNDIINSVEDPRLMSVVPQERDERLEKTFTAFRKNIPNLIRDENHSIQTHLIDLDYFERAILHRICSQGFLVKKVYFKKNSRVNGPNEQDNKKTNDELCETNNEQLPDDNVPSVIMYDLMPTLRVEDEQLPASPIVDCTHPTDPNYEAGKVNIFKINDKTTVTFDDILASIHNHMPQLLMVSQLFNN